MDDVLALMEKDPELRVVFKEFPVLSRESYDAALVAMAVQKQGKYFDFHTALMGHEGRVDQATAIQIAEANGADIEQLRADLEDPQLAELVRSTHGLADELGITGTPSYVVGDKVFIGAVSEVELAAEIARLRADGCKAC